MVVAKLVEMNLHKMKITKRKLEVAIALLTIIFILAPGVSGLRAGEITSVRHTAYDDDFFEDEIDFDVTFKNTGNEKCKYRVYIYDDSGTRELEMEPNQPSWIEIDPGESATVSITSSFDLWSPWSVEDIKKKYVVKLKANFPWPQPDRFVDTKTVCCGQCEETCTQACKDDPDCCCGGCYADTDCDQIYQGDSCFGGTCDGNCECVGGVAPPIIPTCDGEILSVRHIASEGGLLGADEIDIFVTFKNTGTGGCKYRIYIQGDDGTELEHSNWKEAYSGDTATIKVTSKGDWWSVESIDKSYTVELEEESTGIVDTMVVCCGQCDETCPKSTKDCCGGCYAECDQMEANKDPCDSECNVVGTTTSTTTTTIPLRKIKFNYKYRGCGGESKWQHSDCPSGCCGDPCDVEHRWKSRDEIRTKLITRTRTTTQHIRIPKVSHENILDNTQIDIEGIIDQFVDDEGNREISGTINVTLDPDILRMFIFQVNESTISYFPIVYPVKHYLYKKFPSPGDEETKVYTHHDSYGYENAEFGFDKRCKNKCPSTCLCPPDDPFDVTCADGTEKGFKPNEDSDPSNDCSCEPNECSPDPCKSKRSFHEEQGIRIRNGEFEKPLGKEYKNWAKIRGTVTRVLNGFSGYAVKLENNGWIKQRITPIPLHTLPYNKVCFMYGVEECKSGGYLKLYVNGNEKFKFDCNSYTSPYCDLPSGWKKECVTIDEYISSIEFKSHNIVAYIDNVNLGEYYDFIGLHTEKPSSMKKFKEIGFPEYDYSGFLVPLGDIKQESTGHKTIYTLDFETNKLPYMDPDTGEKKEYTLTAKDIEENANITIYSHFRNITIDLFPSPPNPNVNVILREASKIDYEFDKKPYLIRPGEEVHGTLKLHYYDPPQDPIDNEPIYITSGGKVEFLFPESLVDEGYVMTDDEGVAKFTFKLSPGLDILHFFFPGHMGHSPKAVSPTYEDAPVGSTEFRSPFFKGEFLASFLILILILIFILFSYRLFKRRRTDFGEWWKTLRGEE